MALPTPWAGTASVSSASRCVPAGGGGLRGSLTCQGPPRAWALTAAHNLRAHCAQPCPRPAWPLLRVWLSPPSRCPEKSQRPWGLTAGAPCGVSSHRLLGANGGRSSRLRPATSHGSHALPPRGPPSAAPLQGDVSSGVAGTVGLGVAFLLTRGSPRVWQAPLSLRGRGPPAQQLLHRRKGLTWLRFQGLGFPLTDPAAGADSPGPALGPETFSARVCRSRQVLGVLRGGSGLGTWPGNDSSVSKHNLGNSRREGSVLSSPTSAGAPR